jgi:hypothetical protein
MKRLISLFLSIFVLCSLSLPEPVRDLPLDDKITGWLTLKETDYEPKKINLNPVIHISVYDLNSQTYFKTKQPLYLSDGTNKIPLVYQEIFDITPTCTQILAKPKTTLKKNEVYTLVFQTTLGLPELKWKTMDFDCYDYTRPFYKKDTKFNDTILSDYQDNGIYVTESDESNCGGILELFLAPYQPIKILLGDDYTIPQILVNQLTFEDTNSVCNYKLTLIDESGNLSLKSKTGKIQLQKLFKEHIHESQGNCCRIPEGYESPQSKSFFKELIMLTNPALSIFFLVIMIFLILFIISFSKQRQRKKEEDSELTHGVDSGTQAKTEEDDKID